MSNLLAIRLNSLFLLTIFAANLYGVCHCSNMDIRIAQARATQTHKMSCCDDHRATGKTHDDKPTPCSGNDGCGGTHAVKFSLLDKQAAEPFSLHPIVAVAFVHHFIISPDNAVFTGPAQDRIDTQWRHKHSPPDLQSLYQRFLI